VKGLHIIADLYGCRNRGMLASSAMLRETCVAACKDVGLTVLGDHFYQFEGLDATQVGGATGAVVFAESHLAIHTWPERDGATLDVYVCNVTCDNSDKAEKLYATLIAALRPGDVLMERVWRGRDLPLKAKRLAAVK
jgi:S-adenosylmethionine decarboxylase proenzyme